MSGIKLNNEAWDAELHVRPEIVTETEQTAALALKSDVGHDHDAAYAAIGHDHDLTYAPIVHNHDADYLPADAAIGALSDVDTASLANGDLLVYSTAQGKFINTKTLPAVLTMAGLTLSDTYWDDLRFTATGINPPGTADAATRSTTSGNLVFSGTADNVIVGQAQMPHAWKEGTAVGPHLHLRFPTSAASNTRWKLEYDIASVNGNFTNNSGTFTDGGTITVANPENVKKHVIADFTPIAMTGHTFSAIILWKISRLASSDAADNHTSAVELMEFDLHHEIDSFGTSQEYVK
jgi:hypothetical protein